MAEKNPDRPKRANTFLTMFQRAAGKNTKREREESRKKAFGKWMNVKLARRDPPGQANNLIEDIQDGKLLLDLLEVLLGIKLEKEEGNNTDKAISLLKENNVKMEEIKSSEIMNGKPQAILELLWCIILRFQILDVMQEAVTEESTKDYSIAKKIRHWCRQRLESYELRIKDMNHSWRDGLAFNALLHSYKPELFTFDELLEHSSEYGLNHAFSVALNEFGVPQLLEATDVDVDKPDKRLIMMYLCTVYDYLEGPMAKEKAAVVEASQEKTEEETVSKDSLDAVHTGVSPSEHDKAVEELSEKLREVEEKILQTEADKPTYNETESHNSLDNAKKGLDDYKKFMEDLEPVKSQTNEVLNDGQRLIDEGYFDKGEVEQFGERMDSVERKMQSMLEEAEHNRDELSQTYDLLMKQQLVHISQWVAKGEEKMKSEKESNEYEEIKKRLEDHQKFEDELGDISLITLALVVDGSDPHVGQETGDEAKELGPLWKSVWDWFKNHKNELSATLADWQEFKAEENAIEIWLAEKLKMLKEVTKVDFADEEKVNEQLERLEVTQKELEDENILRLQKLEKCGEKLIGNVGEDNATAQEIKANLADFNGRSEEVAKGVEEGKEKIITSRKTVMELQEEMESVTAWIDGVERDIGGFTDEMSAEEKNKIRDEIEIKREERPSTEQKMEGINRVFKDLSETLGEPSTITGDVEMLNERWINVTAAVESFSDKGYPDVKNECCMLRMLKRKFLLY